MIIILAGIIVRQYGSSFLNLSLRNVYQSEVFFIAFLFLFLVMFLLSFKKTKKNHNSKEKDDEFNRLKDQRGDQINEEGKIAPEDVIVQDIENDYSIQEIFKDVNIAKKKVSQEDLSKDVASGNNSLTEPKYTKEEIEKMLEEKLERKMEELAKTSVTQKEQSVNKVREEQKRKEEEMERKNERKVVHEIMCDDGVNLCLPIKINQKEEFILKELKKLGSVSGEELEQILLKNFQQVGLLNGIMNRLKKKLDASSLFLFDIQNDGGVTKYMWIN